MEEIKHFRIVLFAFHECFSQYFMPRLNPNFKAGGLQIIVLALNLLLMPHNLSRCTVEGLLVFAKGKFGLLTGAQTHTPEIVLPAEEQIAYISFFIPF